MFDTFKSNLAAVYLARGVDGGLAKARAFFEAYDRYPAGCKHDLVVVVKGWDNEPGLEAVEDMTKSRGGQVLSLPDDGFDFGAYFRVAEQLPHEWLFFMNSHSRPDAKQWLSILHKAAQTSGVGAVSCTGSWGSMLGGYSLLRNISPEENQRTRLEDYLQIKQQMNRLDSPVFPNPHLRTNAFLVRRALWLEFFRTYEIPPSKEECYELEHGSKSFTRFLLERNLLPIVTCVDRKLYKPDEWDRIGVIFSTDLHTILVKDNWTDMYLSSTQEKRRNIEAFTFGTPVTVDLPPPYAIFLSKSKKLVKKLLLCIAPPLRRIRDHRNKLEADLQELTHSHKALLQNYYGSYSSDTDDSPLSFPAWPGVRDSHGNRLYLPPRNLLNPLHFEPMWAHISSEKAPYINIVVPSIRYEHSSGGPNTAYLLAATLAKQGLPIRIMSSTMPSVDPDTSAIRTHVAKIGRLTEAEASRIIFLDGANRDAPPTLGPDDVFVATAWWTAQAIRFMLPLFNVKCFAYLIQDFEPLLYNASSNYALAMETYSLDYLPIFNTSYLRDHFIADRVGRFSDPDFAKQSLFFDPAVDCSRFYPNPAAKAANGKKRLLFYTRPNAERNLLELGVAALMKIIADQSIDPSEWDFFSTLTGVGGNCRPVELSASPSVTLTPLPLLDLDTWAAEMQRADVVLSMVLSPHHGYALLEAVACGATVVTNTWSVKTQERLKDLSPQIIAGSPTIEGIAGTLVEAMTQQPSTEDNPPSLSYPSSWEDSWRPLVPELLDFFASCGIRPS